MTDDGDLPTERGDDDDSDEGVEDGNITDDIPNNTAAIEANIANGLGVGRNKRTKEIIESHSPLKNRELRVLKRKEVPLPKVAQKDAKRAKSVVQAKTNSEMFPADIRPEMFWNDDVFNGLTFDKASTFVHEHGMLQAKMKMKESYKSSQEKSDDKLKEVKLSEGVDDAKDNLHKVARNLRPVNSEITEQMSWRKTKLEEIIRNLPHEIYGLSDSVATKPIELCHNLANNLTIDMFCPGIKKAVNTKQKTCRTKDGELAVETSEVYGDLDSVQDVLIAWNTLAAIWQKLFPEWPAAQIALRVIFKMRMFAHCVNRSGVSEAKEVMIAFSNRVLTSNSQRAATKKGPLSYERAMNLAGNVCVDMRHAREPPVGHRGGDQAQLGGDQRGGQRSGQRGAQYGGQRGGQGQGARAGAGGAGAVGQARFSGAVRNGNDTLCPFYQVRNWCKDDWQ